MTVGASNEVKAFRRGATPELVATIPVGELPHGIWPSGDGSRVYVALENGEHCVAIDTITNKVIANIPIGQTTQALVYVPNAVPSGPGTEELMPLGIAANTAHLEAGGVASPKTEASVAVNSLGLLDLIQIAAKGLAPNRHIKCISRTKIITNSVNSIPSPFSKQISMALESYRQSGR